MQNGHLGTLSQELSKSYSYFYSRPAFWSCSFRIWRLVIHPFGILKHWVLLKLLSILCLIGKRLHDKSINTFALTSAPIALSSSAHLCVRSGGCEILCSQCFPVGSVYPRTFPKVPHDSHCEYNFVQKEPGGQL